MPRIRPLGLAGLFAAAAAAHADSPAPQNVVSLSASATVEVTKDVLTVAFSTTRDGNDAGLVQAQLKQAVDATLAEARKIARPGGVEVQSGNFALYPRYSSKGGISGWQGSAEVVIEGKDVATIAQFAGRNLPMTIARVGFSLSREAREKVEADVSAEAIARFRGKADFVTRQFGFSAFTVREVAVSTNEPPSGVVPMMRASLAKGVSEEALPVEAGKAAVTATVNGSVQMSK